MKTAWPFEAECYSDGAFEGLIAADRYAPGQAALREAMFVLTFWTVECIRYRDIRRRHEMNVDSLVVAYSHIYT